MRAPPRASGEGLDGTLTILNSKLPLRLGGSLAPTNAAESLNHQGRPGVDLPEAA